VGRRGSHGRRPNFAFASPLSPALPVCAAERTSWSPRSANRWVRLMAARTPFPLPALARGEGWGEAKPPGGSNGIAPSDAPASCFQTRGHLAGLRLDIRQIDNYLLDDLKPSFASEPPGGVVGFLNGNDSSVNPPHPCSLLRGGREGRGHADRGRDPLESRKNPLFVRPRRYTNAPEREVSIARCGSRLAWASGSRRQLGGSEREVVDGSVLYSYGRCLIIGNN